MSLQKQVFKLSLLTSALLAAKLAVAEDSTELKDVVVTATSYEQDIKDAPAAMTVITAEDLKSDSAADLLEAISETVGISLQGQGGSFNRASLSIRGFDTDRSLILIDGRRINATDNVMQHTDYQFDWIPLEEIERIEIVRGPMSALYGSEAFGGVVNIITKPIRDTWKRSIKVTSGSLPSADGGIQFNTSISASGPLIKDKLGLKLSFSAFDRSDLQDPDAETDPAISISEPKKYINGNIGLVYTPQKGHKFNVDIFRGVEKRSPYREEVISYRPYITEVQLNTIDLIRENYSFGYTYNLDGIRAEVRAYRAQIMSQTTTEGVQDPERGQLDDVVDSKVSFAVGENHYMTLGAEYREYAHIGEDKYEFGGRAENSSTAVFAQDEYMINDLTTLTIGGRYDANEQYGSEFSPRVYLVHHYSDDLTFRGGYGHGFKAPLLKYTTEGYITGRPGYTMQANPDLKPETVDTIEFGFNYDWAKSSFSSNYFYNDITDLIEGIELQEYIRGEQEGISSYINVNKAVIQGLESNYETDLSKGFKLVMNHTYLNAVNKETDENLTNRPEHTLNTTIKWQSGKGTSYSLGASYIGKQYVYSDTGQEQIDDFVLWNATFAKQMDKQVRLFAGVENLANYMSDDVGYTQRGRYVYVGLHADF